jgi:hypothetical protein
MAIPGKLERARLLAIHMKRFIACLAAVVIQTACLGVDNFGAYWDKGFVDPALEGSWKKVGLIGQPINDTPGPDMWRFTKDGTSYGLQGINPIDPSSSPDEIAQAQADNDARIPARSLRVGEYLLLMQFESGANRQGWMERYEVEGDTLREYWSENSTAVDYVLDRRPMPRNITKNTGEGRFVVIHTFDDEVFQVLGELGDKARYWRLNCEYRKIQ